ncbi:MAG: glycosyltransferase family 25 protein [Chitinophagaceae bacterium]|nr:glycosyltransferase family 25 protein [Chitinophagaceae bacterium]
MFAPLNNFFDKIYVVTLERAMDRHLHIQQELAGLNYTLMYGADKKNMNVDELVSRKIYDPVSAKQKHIMHKDMTKGEIGCSLSHTMIYQDIISNNYQKVLVLEDDVVVDKNAIQLFSAITSELPADWQLFYLGFAKNETAPSNASIKKFFYHLLYSLGLKRTLNHTIIDHLYPEVFSTHLQKAGFHDCTHAYAITNAAAKILLQQQTPLVYTADNLLAFTITNQLLNAFITVPKLINQQYQVNEQPVTSYLHQ